MDPSQDVPLPGPPKPMPPAPTPPTPPTPSPTADRPRTTTEGRRTGRPEDPPATPGGEAGAPVPDTGDVVVDAALRDLAAVDEADLDATLAAGESVHATLTARLSDLGT